MEDRYKKLKQEVIGTLVKNKATISDLDYMATWLIQEKERAKKNFFRHKSVKEVLNGVIDGKRG